MSGLSISIKNEKSIHSPMLPRHSIILWGSFRGHREEKWGSFRGHREEKWGSFRGRDHFGVDLGIISELGIISGSGSFRGLYRSRLTAAKLQALGAFIMPKIPEISVGIGLLQQLVT